MKELPMTTICGELCSAVVIDSEPAFNHGGQLTLVDLLDIFDPSERENVLLPSFARILGTVNRKSTRNRTSGED